MRQLYSPLVYITIKNLREIKINRNEQKIRGIRNHGVGHESEVKTTTETTSR